MTRYLLVLLIAVFGSDLALAAGHTHPEGPMPPVEPPVQLWVDGPIASLLAKGLVVIPFRTEHLKIRPVYGEAALDVTPRIGHLHITVDHTSWHWLHASEEPIVIQGLSPGAHQLTLDVADANHHKLVSKEVDFVVP